MKTLKMVNRAFCAMAVIMSLLLQMLPSCSRAYDSRLHEAESLMETNPDSSLIILNEVAVNQLRKKSDRALYSLLLTQAMEKTDRYPTNDTVISEAVDYYTKHKDFRRQTISYYYQGCVYFNRGQLSEALVSFTKSLEIAKKRDYYFWAGMSCRGISDIFNKTLNATEELIYAKDECHYFNLSGKQPFVNYSMLDLARAYYNNKKINESMELSRQLLDSAENHQDYNLYLSSLRIQATSMLDDKDFKSACKLLQHICESGVATPEDSSKLCLSMVGCGLIKDAESLSREIKEDNLIKNTAILNIAIKEKNYGKIINQMQYLDSLINAGVDESISHNLMSSIASYYNLRKSIDDASVREANAKVWVAVLGFCIILILLTFFVVHYRNRLKAVNLGKQLLVEQLQDELKELKQKHSNTASLVNYLTITKNELIEELSSISLQNQDNKSARKKIADAVTILIDNLSSRSSKIEELEGQIDLYYGNLMSDFKNDLPNLKEADYRLYLFSVMKFSNATISLFLKENKIEAVYNRKRRLKDKIRKLDFDKQERYLKYLG